LGLKNSSWPGGDPLLVKPIGVGLSSMPR